MCRIFSPRTKYTTWRKLWIALAKAQATQGFPISKEQIKEMELALDTLDLAQVEIYEKKFQHDVMAHLHAFADLCPNAKAILHLGATSAFVTDNTDLIQMRSALELLQHKFRLLLKTLSELSRKYASTPTLAYTHLQPAQPTTVGKRICLWLQDFLIDAQDLLYVEQTLYFLGLKGATGTQASFMTLFEKNETAIKALEEAIAHTFGFKNVCIISGQTYSRKQDVRVLSALAGFGGSSHKCATDLRLLAHLQELQEPFGESQVGSSAMPHKRNPILAERICALSRFLVSLAANPLHTHATQWLERSLDDSANRRISIPEAFLSADALLSLLEQIFSKIEVNEKTIGHNLAAQIPSLALETILMRATKQGKDRQEVHETLRRLSHLSSSSTDLLQKLQEEPSLGLSSKELTSCFTPLDLIGRAPQQVAEFLDTQVAPFLKLYR